MSLTTAPVAQAVTVSLKDLENGQSRLQQQWESP